jgi:hypothetical protein
MQMMSTKIAVHLASLSGMQYHLSILPFDDVYLHHCCFWHTDHRRVTPRYKLLRGFHEVDLAVGSSEQLHWTLRTEDLSCIGIDYKPVLEASTVCFAVGHETDCKLKQQQQQQSESAKGGSCVTLHIKPSNAYRYVS